jgi:hypothetical protein
MAKSKASRARVQAAPVAVAFSEFMARALVPVEVPSEQGEWPFKRMPPESWALLPEARRDQLENIIAAALDLWRLQAPAVTANGGR